MKKTILFSLIFATAAASCTFARSNKKTNTTPEKKAYIQLYSVRDDIQKDFKNTIAAVAAAGYTGIEAAGYDDGKFYGLEPQAFKHEIETAGMEPLSSHTGMPLPEDLTKTDWEYIWRWWDTAIAAHKAAGIKYIVTPWMPTPKTLDNLKAYCNYYNQIGEKCNAAGIKFGYHNHAFEFEKIENEVMLDYMLKNTDPDKVFFQMDVYWTVIGQKSPVEYFHNYPGRFLLLHLKDNKELGQSGMVGFDAIFRNTAKAGTKHLVVEVEKYSVQPIESIKMSLDYLMNHPDFK